MLRGKINIYLPPQHPVILFKTPEFKMAAVSVKGREEESLGPRLTVCVFLGSAEKVTIIKELNLLS